MIPPRTSQLDRIGYNSVFVRTQYYREELTFLRFHQRWKSGTRRSAIPDPSLNRLRKFGSSLDRGDGRSHTDPQEQTSCFQGELIQGHLYPWDFRDKSAWKMRQSREPPRAKARG